jgi:hypothetical protein
LPVHGASILTRDARRDNARVPIQNRVTPLGEIIATPERGLVYGNRGCLHDSAGALRRRYPTQRWIACQLSFRGRRRSPLRAPGRYTELFFLDEVTALAAGHRPCAECRREDYNRLVELWSSLHPGQRGVEAIDAQLEGERREPRSPQRRLHQADFRQLPDGAFVLDGGRPHLVLGSELLAWSPGGYGERRRRPARGAATVITPPSLLALLTAGWEPLVPLLHPSARS